MTACLCVMWEGVGGWTALSPVATLSLCDSERPSGCRGEGQEEVAGGGREERSGGSAVHFQAGWTGSGH